MGWMRATFVVRSLPKCVPKRRDRQITGNNNYCIDLVEMGLFLIMKKPAYFEKHPSRISLIIGHDLGFFFVFLQSELIFSLKN
jgi:hypothetical protein